MRTILIIVCCLSLVGCDNRTDDVTPIECSDNEIVQDNVCVEAPITCATDQTLEDGECVPKEPICVSPEILRDGACILIDDPVITVVGDAEITVEAGTTYVDPGVSAMYDGQELDVVVSGLDSTAILGTYTITYTAVTADGKEAPVQTRTVHVVDTTGPVIEFPSTQAVSHYIGTPYNYDSAIIWDNTDSYEDLSIVITGEVDVDTIGTYQLTYAATDSHGNESTPITKTVNVIMNEEQDFTMKYLKEHTVLYNPMILQNNYTYAPMEWIHQALIIEDGEYVPKLFFFVHNDVDGVKMLKRIDFVCATGNQEHVLTDEVIDYVFEMPIDCMTSNYMTIITYAHDDFELNKTWTASIFIAPDDRSVEGILDNRLRSGNLS